MCGCLPAPKCLLLSYRNLHWPRDGWLCRIVRSLLYKRNLGFAVCIRGSTSRMWPNLLRQSPRIKKENLKASKATCLFNHQGSIRPNTLQAHWNAAIANGFLSNIILFCKVKKQSDSMQFTFVDLNCILKNVPSVTNQCTSVPLITSQSLVFFFN